MADIKITNLTSAGSELFNEQDAIMTELSENELSVAGGHYRGYGYGYSYGYCGYRSVYAAPSVSAKSFSKSSS